MASARRFPLSLRAQVALVIAGLSFLPNLVLLLGLLLPAFSDGLRLPPEDRLLFAGWVLVLALGSAGVGYLLSAQLLEPLLSVRRDVGALTVTSRRLASARLAVAGGEPSEVLALKRSFNSLLERVELEAGRRESFMATLMHDLKTPLVAANHLLAVVRDDDSLSREERVGIVARLTEENRELIALVQKMVDAHRFEQGEVPLRREPVEVAALVRRVAARVAPLAAERGVEVVVRGDARARLDAAEFERALYNLVSNAVRYARSRITLEVFQGLIRLEDDGPGLPEPLERLAQPFVAQPVEIAGVRTTGGAGGLGIYIARRILEAHGGRLVTEVTGPSGTVLLLYTGDGREAVA